MKRISVIGALVMMLLFPLGAMAAPVVDQLPSDPTVVTPGTENDGVITEEGNQVKPPVIPPESVPPVVPPSEEVAPEGAVEPILPEKMVEAEYAYEIEFYQSYYNPQEKNRTTNLVLATEAINGYILKPGEVFSFNQVVGERTRERGYAEARIIQNGEYVMGLGGGICQVSSSLFNAALYSDMEIVARKNHGIASTYVPRGRDATVAWGYIDFQFKNPFQVPVKLVAEAKDGVLRIGLWSQTDLKREKVTLKVTNKNGLYTLKRYSGQVVTYTTTSRYKK